MAKPFSHRQGHGKPFTSLVYFPYTWIVALCSSNEYFLLITKCTLKNMIHTVEVSITIPHFSIKILHTYPMDAILEGSDYL